DLYDNRGNANRSFGNLQADYAFHFLPDLHVNVNVGYDVSRAWGATFIPEYAASNFANNGFFQRYKGNAFNDNFKGNLNNTFIEAYLNYVKDIDAIKSNINVTAGYGYYDNKVTTFSF